MTGPLNTRAIDNPDGPSKEAQLLQLKGTVLSLRSKGDNIAAMAAMKEVRAIEKGESGGRGNTNRTVGAALAMLDSHPPTPTPPPPSPPPTTAAMEIERGEEKKNAPVNPAIAHLYRPKEDYGHNTDGQIRDWQFDALRSKEHPRCFEYCCCLPFGLGKICSSHRPRRDCCERFWLTPPRLIYIMADIIGNDCMLLLAPRYEVRCGSGCFGPGRGGRGPTGGEGKERAVCDTRTSDLRALAPANLLTPSSPHHRSLRTTRFGPTYLRSST